MSVLPLVPGDPDGIVRAELGQLFRIEGLLHRGPLGALYRARVAATGQTAALRTIQRHGAVDATVLQRFRDVSRVAGMLLHPHIAPVLLNGDTSSLLWCSRAFYQGGSLADRLADRTSGPMDFRTCLELAQQVADALDFAGRHGLAHGNLTLDSIFAGVDGRARVADFGVLAALGGVTALRHAEWPAGALDSLAPEQLVPGRPSGPRADQYALAVVMYVCLSGKPPFGATSLDELVVFNRAARPPGLAALRPDLPGHIADAVQRAMSEQPAERFGTVLEFTASLSDRPPPDAGVQDAFPPVLMVPAPSPEDDEFDLPAAGDRPAAPWLWAAAMLLVLGGVAAWLLVTMAPAPPPVVEYVPPPPTPTPRLPTPTVLPADTPLGEFVYEPTPEPATSFLVISAIPWAEVYVDGQRMGPTPIVDLPVSAGEHRLRLTRDGFEPVTRVVHVGPGQTLRLTGIVLGELRQ